MSRYHQFLSARRAQRRRDGELLTHRTVAWFLAMSLAATGGWLARGWHEMPPALRRPTPMSQESSPADPVAPDSAGAAPEPEQAIVVPPPAAAPEPPEAEQPLTGSLQQRLSALSRSAPGPNSIWFYDLTTNETVSVRANTRYAAASTAKVPVVMYLYHLAANRRISLDKQVAVEPGDWADGTGVLQAVQDGEAYTLRELARLALVHSDNIATNMLLRVMGNQEVMVYLREIGVRHDREQNLITPRDLGLAYRHLWRMARRYPDPWAEPLTFLRQTVFNERLPAGVPDGVPVANKIGSVDLAFHDSGIVYHPDRPYILVVMTDGMGEKNASQFIGRVSREVWRFQDAAP